MSDKYADKLLRTGGAVSISEALVEQQRNEIERLRAALRGIVELTAEGCCDDEDGIFITSAAERIAKEALGEDE
jgi:hypothetical protein